MSFKPWPLYMLCLAGLGTLWYTLWSAFPSTKQESVLVFESPEEDLNDSVEVAVIGSGPAGLSAALYTARMDRYTVVFKGPKPGGQLMGTSDVENWPGVGSMRGPDIMGKFEKYIERFGVKYAPSTIIKADFNRYPYTLETDDGKKIHAYSVIICTGSNPKLLGIPGEQEYWGKGVSTCAICDAPFYKDRDVVVIGGGDSAAEQALELSRFARSVKLLVRTNQMRASAVMQDRVRKQPRIEICYGTQVASIEGDGSRVTGVELKLPLNDACALAVDGVFLAIGHDPNTDIFRGALACNKDGYIELKGRSQETSKAGVFAAGDVADDRYRQAGVAAGHGIQAALEADAYLSGQNQESLKNMKNHYFDPEMLQTSALESILTTDELDVQLLNEKRPIVIDFYAPYCSSCLAMLPVIESAAATLGDTIRFLKTDISDSEELAKRFDVTMIPTLLVMQDGKLLSRTTEVMNRQELVAYLKGFIYKPTA